MVQIYKYYCPPERSDTTLMRVLSYRQYREQKRSTWLPATKTPLCNSLTVKVLQRGNFCVVKDLLLLSKRPAIRR